MTYFISLFTDSNWSAFIYSINLIIADFRYFPLYDVIAEYFQTQDFETFRERNADYGRGNERADC